MSEPNLFCSLRALPTGKRLEAARRAADANPANRNAIEELVSRAREGDLSPERLAVETTKLWRSGAVRLTVGFLDGAEKPLQRRIIEHLNAWSKRANVSFVGSADSPDVRIARVGGSDGGFWSYVGTDILSIDADQPTMNLEGFTMNTEESEFVRVVRHEAGHTLGFPHEHMRRELVARIDRAKAIRYFRDTQGWTERETEAQVLTPLEQRSIMGSAADQHSIMCYQIPGAITLDGKPIVGGVDINLQDHEFAAKIYPK